MSLVLAAAVTGLFGLIAIWLRRSLGGDHGRVETHLLDLHRKVDEGFARNTVEHATIYEDIAEVETSLDDRCKPKTL